jgi:hypothetical protein
MSGFLGDNTAGGGSQTVTISSLPNPVVLADGTANPTLTKINVYGEVFNGVTWDRIKGSLTSVQSSPIGMQNILDMGSYHLIPPILTDGQIINIQLDVNGNTKVDEQFAPVYEDNTAGRALVEQRNTYLNITTATTTVVKSGSGFLHLIMINSAIASGTITIYDNTSAAGTKIATITMPTVLLANQVLLRYDVVFSTGLTIVTTGLEDISVSYR